MLPAQIGDAARTANFEDDSLAEDIASRGFAFGQLLVFVHDHKLMERSKLTTAAVVRDIVIPKTKALKCAYADIMPAVPSYGIQPGRKRPRFLMSHWWGNVFLDLVRAIAMYVAGKSSLSLDSYTDEELHDTCWLCVFGVNQHVSICGTKWNPCDCKMLQFKDGPRCEMNKFVMIMKYIPSHALAMDPMLITLKRIWVQAEIAETLLTEREIAFVGKPHRGLLDAALFDVDDLVPLAQDAEASYVEDKQRILRDISKTVGFEKFNQDVRSKVLYELRASRLFDEISITQYNVAYCNDVNRVVWILKQRPELINAQDMNNGKRSLLHYFSMFGLNYCPEWTERDVRLVRLLLGLRADPSLQDARGNTALHLALKVPTLCMSRILDAQYNKIRTDAVEHITCTLFESESNPWRAVCDLVQAGSKQTLSNSGGQCPADIYQHLKAVVQKIHPSLRLPPLPAPSKDVGSFCTELLQDSNVQSLLEGVAQGKGEILNLHKESEAPVAPEYLALDQLQDKENCKIHQVDPNRREQWLSDADFEAAFNMKKVEFARLQEWRLNKLKHDKKLF